MSERQHRRGAEFSRLTRQMALKRARGRCEYPQGCDRPHDGTLDHLTGCMLGRLLGMERTVLKSLDNAQFLCSYHNRLKTDQENYYIRLRLAV
jgi:hypothetical protein